MPKKKSQDTYSNGTGSAMGTLSQASYLDFRAERPILRHEFNGYISPTENICPKDLPIKTLERIDRR